MTKTHGVGAIPPLEYHDDQLDVNLRLYPSGRESQQLEIHVDGQTVGPFDVNLTSADLADINLTFKQRMEDVMIAVDKGKSGSDLDKYLRPLAEAGHDAYQKVFKEARADIEPLLQGVKPLRFAIVAERVFIPWELLYPGDLFGKLSYDGFIGMRHIIARQFPTPRRVAPAIRVDNLPRVGLATYRRLKAVERREVPFFKGLDKQRIELEILPKLDQAANQRLAQLEVIRGFYGKDMHVAHFACEAENTSGTPNQSVILLTETFRFALRDLNAYAIDMSGNPLVVLNACDMGHLNPVYTDWFADAFIKHGARAVIATECRVSDTFAARFAEQLYERLLAGKGVGESLLEVRQYFLKQEGNPGGAFYSLYGPHTVRLESGGGPQ